MGNFLLAFSAIIVFAALLIFSYEIKIAKVVDPKEPFLHDDYDPKKDKTLK
jgi:hypothetical protein